MIRTETTWGDSGYDCDHCGGRILRRTDYETGREDQVSFQCELCGCQWTVEGEVQRVGTGPNCKAAQRQRGGGPALDLDRYRLPILIGVGATALLLLLRLGGGAALRLLLPLAVGAVVVFLLVRYGREQQWW